MKENIERFAPEWLHLVSGLKGHIKGRKMVCELLRGSPSRKISVLLGSQGVLTFHRKDYCLGADPKGCL